MRVDLKQAILAHFNGNFEGFYKRYLPSESLKSLRSEKTGEFKCLCCFHSDTEPSLNLNYQTGTWYCHAEKVGGDIFSFYSQKHGLRTKSDFPRALTKIAKDFGVQNGPGKKSRLGKIAATYDYTDPEGKLLFQVVRFEPKDFRQRRKVKGKWVWNIEGVKPVLYRLPEILKAQEIIITEGEKDADALVSLGFTATTCPMGAGKWRPEYNDYLKGKHIVFCPDNDNQGKEHVAQAGASLDGKSASLKLLELPGLPDKGDVSNWIAGFTNKIEASEKLCILIESTEPWRPVEKETKYIYPLNPRYDYLEYVQADFPERTHLMDLFVPQESYILFAAISKVGKTIFATDLAHCLAFGITFLGEFKVPRPVKTLFLQSEINDSYFQARVRANRDYLFEKGHLNTIEQYRENLIIHPLETVYDLENEAFDKWLRAFVRHNGIECIVIDPLQDFTVRSDNDNKEMNAFTRHLRRLIKELNISIFVVHHMGKQGMTLREVIDDYRGASILAGRADLFFIMRATDKDTTRPNMELHFRARYWPEVPPMRIRRDNKHFWYERMFMGDAAEDLARQICARLEELEGINDMTTNKLIEDMKSKSYGGFHNALRFAKEAGWITKENHRAPWRLIKDDFGTPVFKPDAKVF